MCMAKGREVVSIRIDPVIVKAIDRKAAEEGRTRSNWILQALKRVLFAREERTS